MTKQEFLEQLKKTIKDDAVVLYYDELISDRVEAGEDEHAVVSDYDIKKIVRVIEFETAKKELEEASKTKKRYKTWVVVLALCSTPVTVPIAIAFIAIIFSLVVTSFALVFAGVVGAIGLVLGSGELIIMGESFAYILFNIAGGVLSLGVVGIIGYYGIKLMIMIYNWITVKFFKYAKKISKKEVTA